MTRPRPKPEHMTHLDHKTLVPKEHPRILFRGWIDRLEAEIVLCAITAQREGYEALAGELAETLDFVRSLIRADVLGESVRPLKIGDYDAAQLREYSHHPEQFFGQGHFMLSPADGETIAQVNRLRTLFRQGEAAACKAFRDYSGAVKRPDILLVMNRLSSLCWVWQIKLKAGLYQRKAGEP